MKVEFHGMDGYGGPPYVGTGCFHRRDTLCGRKFSKGYKGDWSTSANERMREESVHELEEKLKGLASCTYDKNTQWGQEVSLSHTHTHTHSDVRHVTQNYESIWVCEFKMCNLRTRF
jgi:hypothetical protein